MVETSSHHSSHLARIRMHRQRVHAALKAVDDAVSAASAAGYPDPQTGPVNNPQTTPRQSRSTNTGPVAQPPVTPPVKSP